MRYNPTTLAAALAMTVLSPISGWGSEIPLGESGGVYTVPVQVNRSVTLQFVVDPGAAIVVIPRSVLRELVANGSVTQTDVVGLSIAELADSSAYQAIQIRLRELRVGDKVVRDVLAAVSPGLTYSLLGQSFLKRFASITLDNQRRVLILSDSGSAPAPQYPTNSWPTPFYPPAATAPPSAYGQPSYWAPAR
jgi:clan AA aspartic protease (TIGR02281 family)